MNNTMITFFLLFSSIFSAMASPVDEAATTYDAASTVNLENVDANSAFRTGNELINSKSAVDSIIDPSLQQKIRNAQDRANGMIPSLNDDISVWMEKSKSRREETEALIKKVRDNQKSDSSDTNVITATKDTVDIGEMVRRYGSASSAMIRGEAPRESIPTLLVFVSMSMPTEMLEQYARQANDAGGVLVLRGLIGNSMRQTVAALQSLMEKTGANTLIDPTLYQRFSVSRVPTIIVTDGVIMPCSPEETDCSKKLPAYDQITGNVSIDYALSSFSSSGSAVEKATEHLNMLRKQPFGVTEAGLNIQQKDN